MITRRSGGSVVVLSGYWSRRITEEHRLVYRYEEDRLLILSCRYHYG